MRKIWDIHGGIHPPENKQQSLKVPIRPAGIPAQLVFPLSQHIGAPAEPVVSVGERVLKGQLIAEAQGFISVPVHASTSGTVIAIEDRPVAHASGLSAPCIVIESDNEDRWIEHAGVADYHRLQRKELLQLIRQAGIAGMGGAGFPAAVKLGVTPKQGAIQTLVINGTECEPYITSDDILMRERPADILRGVEILRYLVNPAEVLIGVEDNKPEAIAALRGAVADSGIQVVEFPTKYPSGGEKQLIQILTGKQVPSGGLPADVGVVCQNVGTAVAIYQAVEQGRPLISRITTVTGEAARDPGNFEVLLGSPMNHLLQLAGFEAGKRQRLVMGGPMMGFTITDPAVPVVKTTNCLLAPGANELPSPPPAQACIRCGMCAEACPVTLLPQQMYWFAQGKEFDKLEAHNIFDCIECGACSWVCPSNIPLVQYYRASKAEIQQLRRDQAKSDHSRTRFEARQERLERETAEKEAQRAARKAAAEKRAQEAAAQSGGEAEDPIQAAIDRARAKKAAAASGHPGAGEAAPDAAQAAIEKAKAARAAAAGPPAADMSHGEKARTNLEKLEKRLQSSQDKLEKARAAGDQEKVVEALEASIPKMQEKITAAREEVAKLGPAGEPAAQPMDAAQAAIERAKAKRAAAAAAPQLSPREQLLKNREAVEKRLQTARTKLAEAETEGSDKVEILRTSIEKLETKLQQVKDELGALEVDS